jgi:hypothetical protein
MAHNATQTEEETMSKIDDMLDTMVQEILKDKLKAIAEQRASDILKNISEPSMPTHQQELPLRTRYKKMTERVHQCPSTAILSLVVNPPTEVARPDTQYQRIWEEVYMQLASGALPRNKLTDVLFDKLNGKPDKGGISSLLSDYINKKYLTVSMPPRNGG